MSIRHTVLAAALLATAGLAFSTAADAQDLAKYRGPYVSGALGINQARDADIRGTVDTQAEFEKSIAGAAALGYALGNGLRLEGELSHRRDGGDSVGGANADGHITVNSFLVNAVYDFSTGGRITPYLGLGAGVAHMNTNLSPVGGGSLGGDADKFAWQGIAGFAVPLADNLAFTTDVRYFDAGNPSFSISSGGNSKMEYRAWTPAGRAALELRRAQAGHGRTGPGAGARAQDGRARSPPRPLRPRRRRPSRRPRRSAPIWCSSTGTRRTSAPTPARSWKRRRRQ